MQEGLAASAVVVAATVVVTATVVVAATATKAIVTAAAYQQEDDDQDPTAVSTKTVHKRTSLKLLYCILSVSYTHLDVYKRQSSKCPAACRCNTDSLQ